MAALPPLAGEPIDKTYIGASDATIYLCPGNRTHFEFIQREVREGGGMGGGAAGWEAGSRVRVQPGEGNGCGEGSWLRVEGGRRQRLG